MRRAEGEAIGTDPRAGPPAGRAGVAAQLDQGKYAPIRLHRPEAGGIGALGDGRQGAEPEREGEQGGDPPHRASSSRVAGRSTIHAVTIAEMSTAAWSSIGKA